MSVEEVGGCGEEADRGQESAEGGGGGIGDRLCTVWVVQHVGTSTATISCLANSGLAQLSTSSRSLKAVYSTHVVPRAGFQVVVQYTRRPQVCHPTSLTFTSPLVGSVRRCGRWTTPVHKSLGGL
jgi:hypothetical protein